MRKDARRCFDHSEFGQWSTLWMEIYAKFAELKDGERDGVDFRVCVVPREGASTVVVAPHGGGIEPGTSEVARMIAQDDLSLATFEGRKSSGNARPNQNPAS